MDERPPAQGSHVRTTSHKHACGRGCLKSHGLLASLNSRIMLCCGVGDGSSRVAYVSLHRETQLEFGPARSAGVEFRIDRRRKSWNMYTTHTRTELSSAE